VGQIETIIEIYPEKEGWNELLVDYTILGMKINKFIQYVENNWKS